MVSVREYTCDWGVFRLGACLTVMRFSAFDAVVRLSAVGLGMSIVLATSALYYVIFDTRYFNSYFGVLQIFEFVDFFVICRRF
jgi:hypothetical protein